jgi:hypothetical protein
MRDCISHAEGRDGRGGTEPAQASPTPSYSSATGSRSSARRRSAFPDGSE